MFPEPRKVFGKGKVAIVRKVDIYSLAIKNHRWLSDSVVEVSFQRPAEMSFVAGQKVMVGKNGTTREYSLVSSPSDEELAVCVRHIHGGEFSTLLAQSQPGDVFEMSRPYGFFTYQSSERLAVFVATGTGVAPFVSYAKSGIENFTLLHGVPSASELYYNKIFLGTACEYIGCFSQGEGGEALSGEVFHGCVTSYLQNRFTPGVYDFYLCGSGAMVRDALQVLDVSFPESRAFSETFYTP